MAAIDLLFDTKLESERLHQIVLGPLLTRSNLLPLLAGTLAETHPESFDWEPHGGLLDLAARYASGRSIYFEIKADGALGQTQARKQLEFLGKRPDADALVYLLLGVSATTTDRRAIHAAADEVSISAARYTLLDTNDLLRALEDPRVHIGIGPAFRDVRDLLSSYREALKHLQARLRNFMDKPANSWDYFDYVGFFAYCREQIPEMSDAGISYVNNPTGGFAATWWHRRSLPGDHGLYLQFENQNLCFKVDVAVAENRSEVRNTASQRVLDTATEYSSLACRASRSLWCRMDDDSGARGTRDSRLDRRVGEHSGEDSGRMRNRRPSGCWMDSDCLTSGSSGGGVPGRVENRKRPFRLSSP
jgi:hypothetical protein